MRRLVTQALITSAHEMCPKMFEGFSAKSSESLLEACKAKGHLNKAIISGVIRLFSVGGNWGGVCRENKESIAELKVNTVRIRPLFAPFSEKDHEKVFIPFAEKVMAPERSDF